jgi:hypothetical protein
VESYLGRCNEIAKARGDLYGLDYRRLSTSDQWRVTIIAIPTSPSSEFAPQSLMAGATPEPPFVAHVVHDKIKTGES